MIEGLLFDLDGVIIDSGGDIIRAVQHTLELFNHPILTRAEIISYVGDGAEEEYEYSSYRYVWSW